MLLIIILRVLSAHIGSLCDGAWIVSISPSSQSAAVTVTSTQCCSCIGTITFKHLILWHFVTSDDILIVPLVFLIVSLLLATQVTLNPTQYSVSEGDGDVVLTLIASKPASFDYTVHVNTVNGTAVGQLF